MLRITRGYIQGAFDGEGCLSKRHFPNKENWTLSFTNTRLVWLEAIARFLTSRGYHPVVARKTTSKIPGRKTVYSLLLRRRAEIKRYLTEFPPLMDTRQKKAAEFFLWDKQYRSRYHEGVDSALQQAFDILKGPQHQGKLL